jgi:hypothetical protein
MLLSFCIRESFSKWRFKIAFLRYSTVIMEARLPVKYLQRALNHQALALVMAVVVVQWIYHYVSRRNDKRLWRSVKYEEVYLRDYANVPEAMTGLDRYLTFYNTQRSHQSLGYKTPQQVFIENKVT